MIFTPNQKRQEPAPNFGSQLAAGKDPGAGFGKGLYGDSQVIMPSAYLKVRDRRAKQHETIGKDGCWVHYVGGDRDDLKDTQYFWGSAAITKSTKDDPHTDLHTDTKAKALYALESILADVAVLNLPDSEITLAISSHNPDKWADTIKRNVEGIHTFEHLNPMREKVTKTVSLSIADIYPEGFGSIAYCLFGGEPQLSLEQDEIAIGLDWGTSTTIISVFDGAGSLKARKVIEAGSSSLYGAVADEMNRTNSAANRLSRDINHSGSSHPLISRGLGAGAAPNPLYPLSWRDGLEVGTLHTWKLHGSQLRGQLAHQSPKGASVMPSKSTRLVMCGSPFSKSGNDSNSLRSASTSGISMASDSSIF